MTHDPATRTPGPLQRRIADLAGRRLVWIAVVSLATALPLVKAFSVDLPDSPARLHRLPEFSLVSEAGRPFGSTQLRGRVWVANFVYTSCSGVCPKLTAAMQRVQYRARNLKGAFHLVSITVDPRGDTTEKLRAYAEKARANSASWTFLGGSLEDVRSLVMDGFQLGMGKDDHGHAPGESCDHEVASSDAASTLFDVAHGEQLVLVDGEGWVRGSFGIDDRSLDRLMRDMGLIANLEIAPQGPPLSDEPPSSSR